MDPAFWKGKRVLMTGHTGFKGGWLSLWLHLLGAEVTGYALSPPTEPSFFETCDLGRRMHSIKGDVRDLGQLQSIYAQCQPELVVHMAAQPLVRLSYDDPVATYATNVMGSVHVLEAARHCKSIRGVLVITSDKCYENREWTWGYRENDPMGGYDPYAGSKGCAELVTASYRNSFFPPGAFSQHGVAVASARAGNVIGGGDWAQDRLVPDICRAAAAGVAVQIRNPEAIRPWQHVLDPLHGYICLLERMYKDGKPFAEGWNFGPADANCQPVSRILKEFEKIIGEGFRWSQDKGPHPHEAQYLKLDCSKARQFLGWQPVLDLPTALAWSLKWYQAYEEGRDMAAISEKQIQDYEEMVR